MERLNLLGHLQQQQTHQHLSYHHTMQQLDQAGS
jgi:hypothetical protein